MYPGSVNLPSPAFGVNPRYLTRFCEIVVIRDTNNNQIESFNGNTVRHRENVVRGLKRED